MAIRAVRGNDVFVDGVKVCNAFRLNIAEGWVDCYVTGPTGYHNNDAEIDDVLSSRLHGHVEISEAE